MTTHNDIQPDWNPKAADVLRDQIAAYDAMRTRCPVAYSELMQWSLFRREDVMRVLSDHETFSNAVSEHLSVPNGMDPPEHTPYRTIVEKYFSAERMAAFEPTCSRIVVDLVQELIEAGEAELMADFALPFAARAQCAFLGWPAALQEPLIRWTQKNQTATFAQDRKVMSEIAREFEGLVDELIDSRLEAGGQAEDDIVASLMHDTAWGRPLSHEEITSILRNWTVGEVGTLSASVGILAGFLAEHSDVQDLLRAQREAIPPAIEEMLRIHGPLVANRRVTTKRVEIGGREIEAGARISLMWVAANRDEEAFNDATEFRLDRDREKSLLWGAGIHVCPGAPLAQLELRIFLEELLARTTGISVPADLEPVNAVYPASGFASLPLRLEASAAPGAG